MAKPTSKSATAPTTGSAPVAAAPSISSPAASLDSTASVVQQSIIAPAPKKTDKLVRGGVTAGRPGQIVTAANRWRENYNPLRGMTIRRAVELLELGQRGDYAHLQWAYRKIERTYPTLSGLIASRCEAPLAQFDWHIKVMAEPPVGMSDADFKAKAAKQKADLEAAYNNIDNLTQALLFMHLADFRGYAHLQKHRDNDGEVYHLECLHQWCICRDGLDGNWFWNPDSRSTSAPLQFLGLPFCIGGPQLPLADFVIRECERPIDEIAIINFIRNGLCEKDWDAFIEIYGVPSGVVTLPPGIPPEKVTEYEQSARQIAEGGSGALPNGSEYKPNDSPRDKDPFTPRMERLDFSLVLAGTGGKLTMMTESTGAGGQMRGNTKVHDKAFGEIADSRARNISECFQTQFDQEVLDKTHPGEPVLVYFFFGAEEEEDVTAICTNVASLKQAGFKADTEWLAEKTGYNITDAPAEPLDPNAPPVPGQPPKPGQPRPAGSTVPPPGKIAVKNRVTDPDPTSPDMIAFAQALAENLQPIRHEMASIENIQDDDLFLKTMREFVAEHGPLVKLLADVNAYPKTAKVINAITTQAMAKNLTSPPVGIKS